MTNVHTLCHMWNISRLDGKVIALTDHDNDIEIKDTIYLCRCAITNSEREYSMGLSAQNMEALGGISSDLIAEHDLNLGLYDGAEIDHFRWDWQNQRRKDTIFKGRIGSVEYDQFRFRAEIETPFSALESVFGRCFQKQCHARFCDEKCGLKEANYLIAGQLVEGKGLKVTVQAGATNLPLKDGILRFKNRPHAVRDIGISSTKRRSGNYELELWTTPKFEFKSGEKVEIIAGCDKSFQTCKSVYGNSLNFRGFPHMPGEDVFNLSSETGSRLIDLVTKTESANEKENRFIV